MAKVKQSTVDTLPDILATALKGLLRGDWISFAVESGDFNVRAKWDKECEGVKIAGYVKAR